MFKFIGSNGFLLVIVLLVFAFWLFRAVSNAGGRTSPEAALQIMNQLGDDNFILLDVRSLAEFNQRHLRGASVIPLNELAGRAENELPHKDKAIFIYCASGNRSAQAARTLKNLGYTRVYDTGGINGWPTNLQQ
ncbi:MAG: rhodanese-like domain-containing protein [Spirochaetaceae bacterium]|nr:rhodanese-like domain-containing protein [Spirochaetaceae bacterium]